MAKALHVRPRARTCPQRPVKNLVVIAPGFVADCVETLEELEIENQHFFLKAGGENYATVPCLNDSDEGMRVIYELGYPRAERLDLTACVTAHLRFALGVAGTIFRLPGPYGRGF